MEHIGIIYNPTTSLKMCNKKIMRYLPVTIIFSGADSDKCEQFVRTLGNTIAFRQARKSKSAPKIIIRGSSRLAMKPIKTYN